MMTYRKLPHGEEQISVLGLGMGGIQNADPAEIEAVIRKAIQNGINFFDLCGGGAAIYAPFGRAIAGKREQVFFQLHFGAVYNDAGEYGWSRDWNRIQETFAWELETLQTDYVDFGFLHSVDEESDWAEIQRAGILDAVCALKEKGVVRRRPAGQNAGNRRLFRLTGTLRSAATQYLQTCALRVRCCSERAGRRFVFRFSDGLNQIEEAVSCALFSVGIPFIDSEIRFFFASQASTLTETTSPTCRHSDGCLMKRSAICET